MSEPITTLGSILAGERERDAIHIAIIPVVAEEELTPGQHVSLLESGKAVAHGDSVGVVDPYLRGPVASGERFWMFMYPNTITGLRHEWSHPAFPVEAGRISRAEHLGKSERWIADHAEKLGLSASALMRDAEEWIEYEEYFVQRGRETWRDNFNPAEFWHHYEVVTGKNVPEGKKQSFYCCSC